MMIQSLTLIYLLQINPQGLSKMYRLKICYSIPQDLPTPLEIVLKSNNIVFKFQDGTLNPLEVIRS